MPIVFNERCSPPVVSELAGSTWLTIKDATHFQSIAIFLPHISQYACLACRVEMTISRGVLRIAGTVVGGTIGYLIMYYHGLAANPYALMASPYPVLVAT